MDNPFPPCCAADLSPVQSPFESRATVTAPAFLPLTANRGETGNPVSPGELNGAWLHPFLNRFLCRGDSTTRITSGLVLLFISNASLLAENWKALCVQGEFCPAMLVTQLGGSRSRTVTTQETKTLGHSLFQGFQRAEILFKCQN